MKKQFNHSQVAATTKSYTYRYLRPENKVYLINKRDQDRLFLRHSLVYSNKYGDKNAVVAYINEDICFNKFLEISKDLITKDGVENNIFIDSVLLEDLKVHCNMLKMPLTVVLNEYCDIDERIEYTEVYLYKNKDETLNMYQKLKNS